ncbi:MAG TPA: hypothetical protein ENJ33_05345 [Thiothrix sp.]|nr:hypothetical protein [Thiothrix sp.]
MLPSLARVVTQRLFSLFLVKNHVFSPLKNITKGVGLRLGQFILLVSALIIILKHPLSAENQPFLRLKNTIKQYFEPFL